MPDNAKFRSTILGAIVALVFIAAATVVGVVISGHSSESTPLVTQVLGFVGLGILALLGLLKAEKVEHKTDEIKDEVDGRMTELQERLDTATAPAPDRR